MLDMKKIASQISKSKCSKLLMESIIFLRVHCIKVGILLPPLMLRVIHPTFTNIWYIINHIRVDTDIIVKLCREISLCFNKT